MILMPSVRTTSSKAWLSFRSRSWMRNRKGCWSPSCMARLRACWGDPASVRIRAAGDVLDPSGRERDEEEDVDPTQEDGLDRQEVAGQHARRLRSEEDSPSRAGSLWCRLETR